MLDTSDTAKRSHRSAAGPPLDFQHHLRLLEERGLLTRIDRVIDKDSELHPLVRWQFQGGLAEEQRRAFLFTNVVDGSGRRYDIPVAVGALGASPAIYAVGMGKPVDDIGDAWTRAIAAPIPPVVVSTGACQEVVTRGSDLLRPGEGLARLPIPVSTPGFDSAPYLTATLCVTRDPESGVQNMGTYRGALKAQDRLGVRMSSRPGGAGGYLHWRKYQKRKEPMPCAIVIGCAPVVLFTGPQKLPVDQDEMAVAGGLAGGPIRIVKAITVDLYVPADAEIVIEGLIDSEWLEPEGPFGESHGHVALEDFNMSMKVTAITRKRAPVFVSIISQVTPSESSVIKKVGVRTDVPRSSARSAGNPRNKGAHDARALYEFAQGHLPAICTRHGANRSVARNFRVQHRCARIAEKSALPLARTLIPPIPMRFSGHSPTAQTPARMFKS